MKKAALLVSLLLALFIAPSPSHAAEGRTIQTLLQECEADPGPDKVTCLAFIWAVSSMLNLNCGFSTQGYSSPEIMKADVGEVSIGALVQTFMNWAKDRPQLWNDTELSGVIIAISSTFPCKD